MTHVNDNSKLMLKKPRRIVCIGASAGGLEAIQDFFDQMPSDTNLAFVVIQHLSPDFKSLMDQLLARNTNMKIQTVSDGTILEENAIYLIPPKQNMTIHKGKLELTEQQRGHHLNLPIDIFLASMARECGDKAISIILSGTGSDGSKGIIEIANAKGLVLVQDPEDAKFDGMPRNAILTKCVDCVLPVFQIPTAILDYLDDSKYFISKYKNIAQPHGSLYEEIFALLMMRYKLDFNHYKPTTVSRRIDRRVIACNLSSLIDYVALLKSNRDELELLYKDLLIGVTDFFRDKEAFELIAKEVMPSIIEQANTKKRELRVWVAACSTGEEAYSLAILISEMLETLNIQLEVKIFATDINKVFLDKASQGIYEASKLNKVSQKRIDKFFFNIGEQFQICSKIRNMVVFAPHNLITDPPFTKIDLVSCRNFLIYIQPVVQKKIMEFLRFSVSVGGYLFLGSSESLGDLGNEMKIIDSTWKLFKKLNSVMSPLSLQLPSTPTRVMRKEEVFVKRSHEKTNRQLGLPIHAYDQMLSKYIDNGILIDSNKEIIHIFGEASNFLTYQKGHFDRDISINICEDIRSPLTSSLHQIDLYKKPVIYPEINVVSDLEQKISLEIDCILNPAGHITHYIILFTLLGALDKKEAKVKAVEVDVHSNQIVDNLESELQHTRQSLQTTIEEVETTNEELQSTNEELLASNEELQSTNEELHSVNEELYTVNSEHQKKIEELTELNTDMDNLLRSTEIGTIFVDSKVCIHRFTPAVADIFQLLPSDIGRSLRGFTHNLDVENLIPLVQKVIETSETYSQETKTISGVLYFMRIMPYLTKQGEVKGAILTFVNITELHEATEQFKIAVQASPLAMLLIDDNGEIIFSNAPSTKLLDYSNDELVKMNINGLLPNTSNEAEHSPFHEYMKKPTERALTSDIDLKIRTKFDKLIDVEIMLSPVKMSTGIRVLCSIMDVTIQRQTQLKLEQSNLALEDKVSEGESLLSLSEQKYSELYENAPDLYVSVDPISSNIIYCNETLVNALGYSDKDEVIGKSVIELYAPLFRDKAKNLFQIFQNTGKLECDHLELIKKNASTIPVSLRVTSVKNSQGDVLYSMSSWRDISTEQALIKERAEYKKNQSTFKEYETLYRTILDSVTDGWWDWDITTNEEYLSPSFKSLFGYEDNEIENSVAGWQDIMFKEDLDIANKAFEEHIHQDKPYNIPVRYFHKDGSTKWVYCRGKAIKNEHGIYDRMVGTHTDITALKEAEKQLLEANQSDQLTDLPNRRYFIEVLDQTLARAKKERKEFCVMYIDVDNFKTINDDVGHSMGDQFLIEVGKRLKQSSNKEDFLARIGGDEFVIVTDLVGSHEIASTIAEKIINKFEFPISIANKLLKTSVSIGIAVYPFAGSNAETLIKHADAAMYRSKKTGKNRFEYYTAKLNAKMQRAFEIKNSLAKAIKDEELSLVYQPIVNIQTGKVNGFEALMRWHSETLGDVSPAEFISIFERNGQINDLTQWLIDTALCQYGLWSQEYGPENLTMFSLNISPIQLTEKNLVKRLLDACSMNHILPEQLILEITETAIMNTSDQVKSVLGELRKYNVGIAMDDFGTGYSSLTFLNSLPITHLKIDQSFIQNVDNKQSKAIVKSLLALGNGLDIQVICEGVEQREQLKFLEDHNAAYVQGFYLFTPMNSQEVTQIMNKG